MDCEHRWRTASEKENHIVAKGIAARTFRQDLLRVTEYKPEAVQSQPLLMYHEWNRLGCQVKGEEHESHISDKNYEVKKSLVQATIS